MLEPVTDSGLASTAAQSHDLRKRKAKREKLHALENIDQGAPFPQGAVYNNLGQLYFFTQRFGEAIKYLTIAKDKYASKSVEDTLDLIEKTNAIIENQQQLAK